MTIYEELQLNQAGSKTVIKSSLTGKEKWRHTAIYLFKIFITMVFCMAFVIGYSKIFGDANSVVGVVILLCIMVFRFADFGIYTPHGLSSLFIIFAILRILFSTESLVYSPVFCFYFYPANKMDLILLFYTANMFLLFSESAIL